MTAELGTTTPGGYLLVLAILLPLAGIILSFTPGGRNAERAALCSTPFGFALACAIAFHVGQAGKPIVYAVGGLPPPLGIALRADGISAVMLVAIYKVSWVNGFFLNTYCIPGHGHGIEFNIALLGMALYLVIAGGGRWCLDRLVFRS